MSELKPCPFCGEVDKIDLYGDVLMGDAYCPHYSVTCDECCAEGAERKTEEEAITAWNTRATPTGTIITEDEQVALKLYKPPFKFSHGYIFDADSHMVADDLEPMVMEIRGWGRIGYMESPEKLQDAVGTLIAKALTKFWQDQPPTNGSE